MSLEDKTIEKCTILKIMNFSLNNFSTKKLTFRHFHVTQVKTRCTEDELSKRHSFRPKGELLTVKLA